MMKTILNNLFISPALPAMTGPAQAQVAEKKVLTLGTCVTTILRAARRQT
jgi:hypothetical protein